MYFLGMSVGEKAFFDVPKILTLFFSLPLKKEPFSRCYFALAMLVNPSVEYGPACEPYLPKILHAIFLAGDR